MQPNFETYQPATPEKRPRLARFRNILGSTGLSATANKPVQHTTSESMLVTAEMSPPTVEIDNTLTTASQQQRELVAANLEANPVLDSPTQEADVYNYMLSQTVLADALREQTTGTTPTTRQESILRSAFSLLTQFESGIPAAMNDTYLLAHAIDRTRNPQLLEAANHTQDWLDLKLKVRSLLEPRDDATFDPNATLRVAFDRAEAKDTDIISEYRKVELGNYVVTKTLSDTINGTIKQPKMSLYRTLAELHKAGTLTTTHAERRTLGDSLDQELSTPVKKP